MEIQIMKTIVILVAMAALVGCAHRAERGQGNAPSAESFESGPRVDPELPYRTGPGLPSNERDYPRSEGNEIRELKP